MLEEFFEPTCPKELAKKAQRLARSEKARKHRAEVKQIKQRRDAKQ